jgi:hypothetical protein
MGVAPGAGYRDMEWVAAFHVGRQRAFTERPLASGRCWSRDGWAPTGKGQCLPRAEWRDLWLPARYAARGRAARGQVRTEADGWRQRVRMREMPCVARRAIMGSRGKGAWVAASQRAPKASGRLKTRLEACRYRASPARAAERPRRRNSARPASSYLNDIAPARAAERGCVRRFSQRGAAERGCVCGDSVDVGQNS